MHANDSRQLRKELFYTLVESVMFGAGLGLVFVRRDAWSWFEIRGMDTATTIAVASVAGLACDLARVVAPGERDSVDRTGTDCRRRAERLGASSKTRARRPQ